MNHVNKTDSCELYSRYRTEIEELMKNEIPFFGEDTPVRKACEYALINGGKRFRPLITLLVGEALNPEADVSIAALAVEYFHSASLVADDLPCMDDDDMRRNKPSVHKTFGEPMALLVTYALIAEGYGCLCKNAVIIEKSNLSFSSRSSEICTAALENSTFNTGLHGATGGQFMDIAPPDLTLETVKEIIRKKTGSLFEISFVIGWLYAGGNFEKLSLVKKAAGHFGLAFQIADDIGDREQDILNERKVNVASLFGLEKAEELLEQELAGYLSSLELLGINTPALQNLAHLLKSEMCRLPGI